MRMVWWWHESYCHHHNQVNFQPPDGDNVFFGFGCCLLHAHDHLHPLLVQQHSHHNDDGDADDGDDNEYFSNCSTLNDRKKCALALTLWHLLILAPTGRLSSSLPCLASSSPPGLFHQLHLNLFKNFQKYIFWPGVQSPLQLLLKSSASSCSPQHLAPSPLSGASPLSLVSSWSWSSLSSS